MWEDERRPIRLYESAAKEKMAIMERLQKSACFVEEEKEVKTLLAKSSTFVDQRKHKSEGKTNTKTKNSGIDVSPLL